MNKEIERKFLVKSNFKTGNIKSYSIKQAYLCTKPERTVRIRVTDNEAFLTVKGKTQANGMVRSEYESLIDRKAALGMLKFSVGYTIEKRRYIIEAENNLKWEIDVFEKENSGLIIAEIELPEVNTKIKLPDWISEEVTGCIDFYNLQLSQKPINMRDNNFLKKYNIFKR